MPAGRRRVQEQALEKIKNKTQIQKQNGLFKIQGCGD
jgi:hypothetical protein